MVAADQAALMGFVRAVAGGDEAAVRQWLTAAPGLANAHLDRGATRQEAQAYYLDEIGHYVYAGDTALHVAAAGYWTDLVAALVAAGAEVGARNRRGSEPLHYAVDGVPGSPRWNPVAQAATIIALIAAGADPNATDASGVTPLHRAVRTRCAAAVRALLDRGADAQRPNRSGSTPMRLAMLTTGRSGSGSVEAKAQQQQIIRLLELHGSNH